MLRQFSEHLARHQLVPGRRQAQFSDAASAEPKLAGVDASWLLVVAAYLFGTFPTAVLVGRVVGHDPTSEGSNNPGATNMYRIAGKRAGALVLLADLGKGLFATGLGQSVGGKSLAVACGAAAVVGHIFPAQRRFRGGKGVATLGGMSLVAWTWPAVIALGVWVGGLILGRRAALASMGAAAAMAVGTAVVGRPLWEIVTAALLAALVVIRHRSNIERMLGRHPSENSVASR